MAHKFMKTAVMTALVSLMAGAAYAGPPEGKGKNKVKKAKERVEQADRRREERRQDADRRRDEDRRQDADRRRDEERRQDADRRRDEDRRQDADRRRDSGFSDELRENREGKEAKGQGKKKGWFARWREDRAERKRRKANKKNK